MTKQLTPLEALEALRRKRVWDNKLKTYRWGEIEYYEQLDILETALKESENTKFLYEDLVRQYELELETKSKKEQALEIIKDNLNVDEILFSAKGVCNSKDYDLLKEVIKEYEPEL